MPRSSPLLAKGSRKNAQDMRTVDLFCGCGGMSRGLQKAGLNIVGAFDNWGPALSVYRRNFRHEAHEVDLGDATTHELIAQLSPRVIAGGPPCQDFSSAGPKNTSSVRANLLSSFVDIVEASMPRFFIIENVPRIRLRPVFKNAHARLRNLGYGFTIQTLDASYCGVPQKRQRIFWIGALGHDDGFMQEHLDRRQSKSPLTMRSYFGSRLDTDHYFRVPTNYTRRGVFSVDEPCVTIRAVDRPIPKGYPGHPEDSAPIGPNVRGLTVLERSYVQTFPRSYKFEGTKTDLNQMIGNAVPVKLAECVGRALMEYAREHDGQ